MSDITYLATLGCDYEMKNM